MRFLEKIIDTLLEDSQDLGQYTLVLPGKRPIVFIKQILERRGYNGFLPECVTIEDLTAEIAQKLPYKGVGLWLFAYHQFMQSTVYNREDFSAFLKWFPTLLKDWDDILKFGQDDEKVFQYLYDEERIKNWAENLGDISPDSPRRKFLTFWRNAYQFIPQLKKALQENNWATEGMLHETALQNTDSFVKNTQKHWVFCGFNALTPFEEKLMRELLQWDKAQAFFHTDSYYMQDEKQEAGHFLRRIKQWKEFNDHRPFQWVENQFKTRKHIEIVESPGNVAQTKYLSTLLQENRFPTEETAIVLLDENLLPAALDAVSSALSVNITMGFPLKNLSFSNAIKHIFHLQKQLEKNPKTYYYNDVLPILEEVHNTETDTRYISEFKTILEKRNLVYIRPNLLQELLGNISYFEVLRPQKDAPTLLNTLLNFCRNSKENEIDDILYENISIFERAMGALLNQLAHIQFSIPIDALEQLISQMLNTETLSFEGEPLQGLQIMGLLETRLLNFKHLIMLSMNEGKIPASTSENTFIPFDVRRHFGLYTHQENDSIYAYHFYRLIQDAEQVALVYNGLTSGVNTGEKSRFAMQLEYEASHLHTIENKLLDIPAKTAIKELISIEKTPIVMEKLERWKRNISASSLTSYIYNPIQFYLQKILSLKEAHELSEELTSRDYGTLVHHALETLYTPLIGITLTPEHLSISSETVAQAIDTAIQKLEHQGEFYERGINYIHKTVAEKVVRSIIEYDKKLLQQGHELKIIGLEKTFEEIPLFLDETQTETVYLRGVIDRLDILDGTLRIIDYKTAKVSNLNLNITPENLAQFFHKDEKKQALQLVLYLYVLPYLFPEYQEIKAGIWSFSSVGKGVISIDADQEKLNNALDAIREIIKEIINPDIPFVEK